MKKANSVGKTMQKGKSMSSIHHNHQSRLTNKSIDTRKVDSKVSKTSKANSMIKVHQPLTIQQRQTLKQSKLQNSKTQQLLQGQNSRKKIQSQLENKKSYDPNPISFRQTQQSKTISLRPKQSLSKQTHQKQSSSFNSIRLKQQNQKLAKQNKQLKDRVFRLQQSSIEDKEKIKTLITRISQIKRDTKINQNSITSGMMMSKSKTTASYAQIMKTRGLTERQNNQSSNYRNQAQQTPFRILQPSASQSKYSRSKQTCPNPQCEQRKKYLQGELYKERIKRDQLQQQKRYWQRNKDQLKRQYQDLLYQIQTLRQQSIQQEQQ